MTKGKSHHRALLNVFRSMCESVDSQLSRRLREAAANGDWAQIFSSEVTPKDYDNARSFAYDYALTCFFTKYEGSVDADLLHERAMVSFKETELRVAETNRVLRSGSAHRGVEGIISDARRKIIQILNPQKVSLTESQSFVPWDEVLDHCEWGKGATASLPAAEATLDNKILEPRLGVTRRAMKYAHAFLAHDTSWVSARLGIPVEGPVSLLPSEFHVSEDGRFATVEKNWKSRRSIDIQPTLNLFFQKGIGGVIRQRLKRCGIDLDDQSRNQWLASIASQQGYATIDLAKASDTISSELVRLLLPPEWFEVLWDLRTHSIRIGEDSCYLHKFSAMGNGYTFELESLIFYALSWAVVRCEGSDHDSKIAVYGDDIIVNQCHAIRLIEVLEYCGFTTNVDKTYVEGRFFESCGKHYFDGYDVTPFYQKEALVDYPSTIRLCNRLYRWAERMGSGSLLNSVAYTPWVLARHYCDDARSELNRRRLRVAERRSAGRRQSRLVQPIHALFQPSWVEGDGAVIDDSVAFTSDRHGTLRLSVMLASPSNVAADNYALLATSLRRGVVVDSPFNGRLTLRGTVKYQLATRRVSRVVREVRTWSFEHNDEAKFTKAAIFQKTMFDLDVKLGSDAVS